MNPTSILTATHATPPTLETKIKRWVELDNRIKESNDIFKDIRTEKSVIHDEIIELVEEKQLGKVTVNISDGKLKFVSSKHTAPLTLTYIEKCLTELITNGKQVEQIMAYEKPSSAKKGDGNGHDDGSDGDSDADE